MPLDSRHYFSSELIRGCLIATALTGLVLGCSDQALASGFMVRETSTAAIAMASAGSASLADGPETSFANPAGMTRLNDSELELGIAGIFPSVRFNGGASAFGMPVPGNGGGNGGRIGVVPNLYWVFDITDRLKGGVAITAPFGKVSEYSDTWSGRYLGIKTAALSADFNPNIAYRLTDALSIGGGISVQYLKVDVSSAIAQFAIFGPGTPDAFYDFRADDWAFGYNLGALLEVRDGTRIGLTYRSRIDHPTKGELDFSRASPFLGLVSGPASADVHLPASTTLSITNSLDSDFDIAADIQFTAWSVFKQVAIMSRNIPFVNVEGYQDSWMVSVGGVYRPNERWTLRGGVAWDESPVADRFRTVGAPDADRYVIGFGFGYGFSGSFSLDGGYSHSFVLSRASMSSSLNNTDPIAHAVVLNGNYDLGVDIFAFSVRYRY